MKHGLLTSWLKNKHTWLIVFICLCCSACFKKKSSSDFSLKDTFRFVISTEPPTLDWNKAVDTTSNLILDNIMEGLVDYDFSGSVALMRPGLAEKWTSSHNNKHWTFILKKNVYWTDGEKLTAHHVKDSWQRLLNPQTASEYAYFLYVIKNAKKYNQGLIKDFSKVGVSVSKKGHLLVELEKGQSYFPYFLAHSSTFPIRKELIKKHGHQWTEPQNLVTLGAYRLKKWEHDKKIILVKNPRYHNKPSQLQNVVIYIIEENTTVLNLFERGSLDAISSLPSRELPILRKKPEYKEQAILAIYYYGFNVKKPPFNDVRVRKAFNKAIDRTQIIKILQNSQTVLSSWIPKGVFGYHSSLGMQFDPKASRQLLAEAGYSDPSLFPKVILSYNTHEDNKKIAESVQAQLKKHLSIVVELSSQEWKSYLQSLSSGRHDIYRLGWRGDYPDPHTFMNLMTADSTNNHTFWRSKKYDTLVSLASALPNNPQRYDLYKKAQKILVEKDLPVIPVYSARSHWLIHKRVAYFPLNIMGRVHFKEVRLKKVRFY